MLEIGKSIRELNEKLNEILQEDAEDKSLEEQAKELVVDYRIDDLFDSEEISDILKDLAEYLGYKIYYDRPSYYIVKNVKGRPYIDEDKAGLDFSKDEHNEAVNLAIRNFATRLESEIEGFAIVGKMGGYWGLEKPEKHLQLSDTGYDELANILAEAKRDCKDEDVELYELLSDNYHEYAEQLRDDMENFEFDEKYLDKLKGIMIAIDEEESAMNTKDYWEGLV